VFGGRSPIALPAPEAWMAMTQQVEEMRRQMLAEAAHNAKRVEADLAAAGLETLSCAMDGDPRDILVEACRTERADLIVLGSHGRTGLARLLMGSVASHVVSHAPCSVLVVRRPAVTAAA
jgi:nucleotide-binding universal stress UspA family protein